ncbi:MAG TPA: hypothetical protein VE673_11005 [Pseudonocardiaceae bacterium]|nr:hypothetical protein [Pseudonocardiaceae bacterium]
MPRSARSIRALARDVATLRADIEQYRAQLRDALELVSLLPNDPADRRGAHNHRGSSGLGLGPPARLLRLPGGS